MMVSYLTNVTPLVGVWIEMIIAWIVTDIIAVTPLVGVWIEIRNSSAVLPLD